MEELVITSALIIAIITGVCLFMYNEKLKKASIFLAFLIFSLAVVSVNCKSYDLIMTHESGEVRAERKLKSVKIDKNLKSITYITKDNQEVQNSLEDYIEIVRKANKSSTLLGFLTIKEETILLNP